MTRLSFPHLTFALLCLVSCAYQVDVTFSTGSPWIPHVVLITCLDLPPGVCCHNFIYALSIAVTFDGLQVGDVSVAWGRRTTQASLVGGCSGTVLRTGNTPGTWTYDWIHNFDNVYSFGPSGASYIRLSPRLPPGQAEADWLHVEGMKALVWGGGKWITGGASGMLDRRRKDAGLMPRPQISNNRAFYKGGQFYASPPPAARFPDLITVNGTMYTAVGTNGTVYNDAAGKLLDVNTLGS